MKTKNNVQKAILKSLAMGISLVLISLTVNAQDFWKTLMENNSLNSIALATVDNTFEASPASVDANAYAKFMKEENEETLDVEVWMIDENNFGRFFTVEEESENPLELEDWMTNETLFDANSIYFETETEKSTIFPSGLCIWSCCFVRALPLTICLTKSSNGVPEMYVSRRIRSFTPTWMICGTLSPFLARYLFMPYSLLILVFPETAKSLLPNDTRFNVNHLNPCQSVNFLATKRSLPTVTRKTSLRTPARGETVMGRFGRSLETIS